MGTKMDVPKTVIAITKHWRVNSVSVGMYIEEEAGLL